MKKIITYLGLTFLATCMFAQGTKNIKLNPPDTNRGLPVMKALANRASASTFDSIKINIQDMSDLLWAANGINRPSISKRTAPSAMNAQEIDVYVFLKSGVYLYEAEKHMLNLVTEGDNRRLCFGRQELPTTPPLFCVLVGDISKFKWSDDSTKKILVAEDAGIVSQNISVFCASVGLATRPRATMDQAKLRELLKLKDSQFLMLNHPVSYKKE
jgi:SagB-type dehydrogenase family enzyme